MNQHLQRRWLFGFILATTVILGVAAGAMHVMWPSAQQLAKQSARGVYKIETYDFSGALLGTGTGFMVGPSLLVTNRHVVDGASKALVFASDGQTFEVSGFLAIDRANDLILLRADSLVGRPLPLDSRLPDRGTPIFVIGSPKGLEGSFTTGVVSAIRDDSLLQISAPISAGSSGSPVLSANGRVVGVATMSLVEGQNLNFAVPSTYVGSLRAGAGSVAPLIQASRGSRNDLERRELVGSVQVVVEYANAEDIRGTLKVLEEQSRRAGIPRRVYKLALEWYQRDAATTTYAYDRRGFLVEQYGGGAGRKTFQRDPLGRLSREVAYGTTGEVTSETVCKESASSNTAMTCVGRPTQAGWPEVVKVMRYDTAGTLLSVETEFNGTKSTQKWFYSSHDWPLSFTSDDALNKFRAKARIDRDLLGNWIAMDFDGRKVTTDFTYDSRGNWTSKTVFQEGVRAPRADRRREISYYE